MARGLLQEYLEAVPYTQHRTMKSLAPIKEDQLYYIFSCEFAVSEQEAKEMVEMFSIQLGERR